MAIVETRNADQSVITYTGPGGVYWVTNPSRVTDAEIARALASGQPGQAVINGAVIRTGPDSAEVS